jgi:UDP-N-acetylmuramyl pentapeptide phosphotransferase/UDP-N-acetylglucosamine-1-phosphate transferase
MIAGMAGEWIAAAVAFTAALALTPLVRAAAPRLGLVDQPNARSSHARLVPRGGGLAIVAAVVLALALTGVESHGRTEAVFAAGALALALLGLADDRFSLSAGVRGSAQILVALALALAVGGLERMPLPAPLDWPLGVLGVPLAVLWIISVVNFVNFLDGIDGLAASQAAVTGTGICLAGFEPGATLAAAAVAAAAVGFLPFNWSQASVFLGDVGSYFLGFALAGLPLLAPRPSQSAAVLLVALSLWLFLADAFWTLACRTRRGARFYEAHREHLYQHLALRYGHARVTLAIAAGSVLLTAAALAAFRSGAAAASWAALALACALFAGEWAAARRVRAA